MTNGKNCWFLPFCFILFVFFFFGGGGGSVIVRFGKKAKRHPKKMLLWYRNNLLPKSVLTWMFQLHWSNPTLPPPTSPWNPFAEMINITQVTTKIKEGWHDILCLPSCEKNQVSLPYLTHHMRCWWCHATQHISRMSNHASFSLLIELKLCEKEVRLRRGE